MNMKSKQAYLYINTFCFFLSLMASNLANNLSDECAVWAKKHILIDTERHIPDLTIYYIRFKHFNELNLSKCLTSRQKIWNKISSIKTVRWRRPGSLRKRCEHAPCTRLVLFQWPSSFVARAFVSEHCWLQRQPRRLHSKQLFKLVPGGVHWCCL